LFCKNERAVVRCKLAQTGQPILLVPVAAILVACIRFHFCDALRHLRSSSGEFDVNHDIPCNASFAKGQEMGWFEHGSTIIVFTPDGFEMVEGVTEGSHLRVGQALMQVPKPPAEHEQP
jgi:phosphatidylserine decarboxylase